ncbi:MAG TPA: hypothetical protein VHS96_12740, partial [Bacteroidia bacterium]|nr:hypothetical protein [Bacteroidia bacterium]
MKQLLSISFLVMALGCSLPGCEKADFPGQNGVSMHIYGTQDLDLAVAVVQTADGGFAIAGSITNLEDSTNEEDIVLIRTNANGELLWRKSYDGIGRDRAEDMLLLPDGGFLIVGQQGSGSLGGVDMVVFRTDAVGEVIWQKNFGGAADDYGTAVVQTTSGEFVAVGYTSSLGTNASTIYPNLLIVKVDAAGNEIWTRAYGGSNEERAFGVSATQDGGVAVAGNVYFDSLDYDAGLWRIGSNGDSLWGYHGITQAQDEGHGVATLANGNLCLLGYTSNGND